MTKTYEQRLHEIATDFAKVECKKRGLIFDPLLNSHLLLVSEYIPLAAIALKHMAEEWEDGYKQQYLGYTIEKHLIDNGLIQPQKP